MFWSIYFYCHFSLGLSSLLKLNSLYNLHSDFSLAQPTQPMCPVGKGKDMMGAGSDPSPVLTGTMDKRSSAHDEQEPTLTHLNNPYKISPFGIYCCHCALLDGSSPVPLIAQCLLNYLLLCEMRIIMTNVRSQMSRNTAFIWTFIVTLLFYRGKYDRI